MSQCKKKKSLYIWITFQNIKKYKIFKIWLFSILFIHIFQSMVITVMHLTQYSINQYYSNKMYFPEKSFFPSHFLAVRWWWCTGVCVCVGEMFCRKWDRAVSAFSHRKLDGHQPVNKQAQGNEEEIVHLRDQSRTNNPRSHRALSTWSI